MLKAIVMYIKYLIMSYEGIVQFLKERDLSFDGDHLFNAILSLWIGFVFMFLCTAFGILGYFILPGIFITFSVVFGIIMLVFFIFMICKVCELFDWA